MSYSIPTRGRMMFARYAGTCADCKGPIAEGEEIRYDGSAHHSHPDKCDTYRAVRAKERLETATKEVDDIVDQAPAVQEGLFTVVDADGVTRRTFRVKRQSEDNTFAPGELIVRYLAGPDNEGLSYVGFAFIKAGELRVWRRYQSDTTLVRLARVLLDVDAQREAGLAYALESGNCYVCGRTLTVPASINAGIGPECAKKRNQS